MTKVLIVPMGAMARTAGSAKRAHTLAKALKERQIETAICQCKDPNYRKAEREYIISTPVPMGLPEAIGKRTFPIANKLGITKRKEVKSFAEVLRLTGNSDYKYIKKATQEIREAIKDFEADIIYSEFSIPAILAARLENKKVYGTISYPTQSDYYKEYKYKEGINRFRTENNLKPLDSILDIFDELDVKFVPSIEELEPIQDVVTYAGAWEKPEEEKEEQQRTKIVVYMGNGTISPERAREVIEEATEDEEVYIAGIDKEEKGRINTAKQFNFKELLPQAKIFINHGGQNSIIDGLIYGVPQIICPGKVFERKYNARSIDKNHAGIYITDKDFTAKTIKEAIKDIGNNPTYTDQAKHLGNKLREKNGAATVADEIERSAASD